MDTFDRAAIKQEAKNVFNRNRSICVSMMLLLMLATAVITAVSAGFLGLLLSGVITVTGTFFFIKCWRDTPVAVSAAVSETFDSGFLRKMGGMLWMDLQIFLWSLLLIVPGIVKAYGTILTPYILADCPNVQAMDACRISERMMRGHRMDYFVLDLSFFGWELLSALTLGILHVLYVGPYLELTKAGVYEELKNLALESGAVTQEQLDGQPLI